jgi:hypothetical protein
VSQYDTGLFSWSSWPEHGNQNKAGSDGAKASADVGVQVTCRQALNETNDHGADDRSGDAIEAAYDHYREYLETDKHRANAACASCHNLMDPIGFSLENFDAIGRWRTVEEGQPVDCSGGLPDGSKFSGVSGLEEGLRKRPELFVGALSEKLMTFALGRGVESYDAPAIRKIVHDAQAKDFRFSSIIIGIVNSTPFTMRKSL